MDLNVPTNVCSYIFSLLHVRHVCIFSSLGSKRIRSNYRRLPQKSCLSLIIFNAYTIAISNVLTFHEHLYIFYTDDIVVFSANISLAIAIHHINAALKQHAFAFIFYSSSGNKVIPWCLLKNLMLYYSCSFIADLYAILIPLNHVQLLNLKKSFDSFGFSISSLCN